MAKTTEKPPVKGVSTVISGLRVSDDLLARLKENYDRRVRKDQSAPDQYKFTDHLRFLWDVGLNNTKY